MTAESKSFDNLYRQLLVERVEYERWWLLEGVGMSTKKIVMRIK
jgi:hypothetical protein